jgi:hypothetical protein
MVSDQDTKHYQNPEPKHGATPFLYGFSCRYNFDTAPALAVNQSRICKTIKRLHEVDTGSTIYDLKH